MQRLSIEIVNVDEEVAENAVNVMLQALTPVVDHIKKSLNIEPHDEARGIWASLDLKDHATSSTSSYKQSVVAAVKAVLNLQFHNVAKANVYVTLTDNKGEQ